MSSALAFSGSCDSASRRSPSAARSASLGARLAHALPKRALEISFGIFLLLVCARFFVSLF